MDKISIIIPIYNGEKYLKRCLDSVIGQTYKNIEIICINDGSKDSSLDILKEYKKADDRVVIIDKQNAGVSSARNDGITQSTGKYISFVDADDWLELDAIESLYNALVEKNVDIVRANYYRNSEENNSEVGGNLEELSNVICDTNDNTFATKVVDKLLNGKIPCFLWLLLAKKENVLKTTLFKKDVQLMEDTIFYIELFTKADSIYFLDKPTYHYFCNENSCTRSSVYYIRNMYNVVRVNNYIKQVIKESGLDTKERLKLIDTVHTNMIISFMFLLYKTKVAKKNIIEEIDKLLENKDALAIFQNADIKDFPLHLREPIKLIIKRKYKTLFAFYKFRIFVKEVKDVLIRRKDR